MTIYCISLSASSHFTKVLDSFSSSLSLPIIPNNFNSFYHLSLYQFYSTSPISDLTAHSGLISLLFRYLLSVHLTPSALFDYYTINKYSLEIVPYSSYLSSVSFSILPASPYIYLSGLVSHFFEMYRLNHNYLLYPEASSAYRHVNRFHDRALNGLLTPHLTLGFFPSLDPILSNTSLDSFDFSLPQFQNYFSSLCLATLNSYCMTPVDEVIIEFPF